MEEIAEKAAKIVDLREKDLLVSVGLKEPTYSGLEYQLSKFRTACQDFIFLDFQAAARKKTETRLWDAHGKVNQKFRPYLARFREGEGKKKPVERRKAEKLYLDFIKSSTRFYRGYIQRLALHFKDVPEVFEIARKFSLETLSADPPVHVDLQLKKQIIRSCHATLVQLGDLSRYRETELQSKERNWGPAKGYYDLATALDPTVGTSYNQLAVIALKDQDHLRALYYLHRALSVENPAPQARGNLELEFKKLRARQSQSKANSAGDDRDGANPLATQFVIFHARCFAAEAFAEDEEQQNEILHQWADELRERPFDTMIRKFCLINIAAEYLAAKKVTENENALQSFKVLQHFNVGTFFMLLKLLLDDLQQLARAGDAGPENPSKSSVPLPAVSRRILPHLRLYSAWFLSNVHLLLLGATDSLSIQVQELWQVYAEALSLLVATFPVLKLPELSYLLEEDQDTLSFTPFSDLVREQRYKNADGTIKSVASDKRDPELEMLHRIRDLVKDGAYLCRHRDEFGSVRIPLVFGQKRFVFQEEIRVRSPGPPGVESTHDESTHGQSVHAEPIHTHTSSANSISREDIEDARRFAHPGPAHQEDASDAGVSSSMTSAMENMVNDLTQSEMSDAVHPGGFPPEGPPTPTLRTPVMASFAAPASVRASPPVTAWDLVRQMQQSPSGTLSNFRHDSITRPSLPSIWNTPFAPRPGETPGSSPRPNTAHRTSPPSAALPRRSSMGKFQEEILQAQHEIQMRSSPPQSLQPTLSTYYESPMGPTSTLRTHPLLLPPLSPWQSSPISASVEVPTLPSKVPRAALFGAIGEPRPQTARTPTSGQPG